MVTSQEVIASDISGCTACHLHSVHHGPVPGILGKPHGVIIVGEAPGHSEDLAKAPFVGKSGRYFRAKLREAGFPPSMLSFANVISCRPPNNRNPEEYEISACRNNLLMQINLSRARLIISCGQYAARIFASEIKLKLDHGRVFFPRHNLAQIPVYHPSFVMSHKKHNEEQLEKDLRFARGCVSKPSEMIPDTCRICGGEVERYNKLALAYCKYHYFETENNLILQRGML